MAAPQQPSQVLHGQPELPSVDPDLAHRLSNFGFELCIHGSCPHMVPVITDVADILDACGGLCRDRQWKG